MTRFLFKTPSSAQAENETQPIHEAQEQISYKSRTIEVRSNEHRGTTSLVLEKQIKYTKPNVLCKSKNSIKTISSEWESTVSLHSTSILQCVFFMQQDP